MPRTKSKISEADLCRDFIAWASAPRQLSRWKVGALRVCAVLELQGFINREDFNRFAIDPRRWTVMDWLKYDREKKHYVSGSEPMKFPQQHPTVYAQILEDLRKEYSP